MSLKKLAYWLYRKTIMHPVKSLFFRDLIACTDNFSDVKWCGHPIWQNVLDLWIIQETICEIRPELLIECGTNRGGSSLFYANVFDLLGSGRVITIDIEQMHELSHSRVHYFLGSSTSEQVVTDVRRAVSETHGPVMVILDSDHSMSHVLRELELYTPFVTPGSYCLVQDGVIDTLGSLKRFRPGPLKAIESFIRMNCDFSIDESKSNRFLISHHPRGWLRRNVLTEGSRGKTR